MEQNIFIKLLNMSYQGGIVICFILLARYILHLIKAPKRYAYYLWLIPFIRLICPFSFESVLSILPRDTEPVKQAIVYEQVPQIHTSSNAINQVMNNVLPEANPVTSINPMQIIMVIAQVIWLVGIGIFLIYSLVSYIRLKKRLIGSINFNIVSSEQSGSDNIYISDHIATPFVLGFLKPRIYLPSIINEKEISYILMHEQAHIKRKDHMIKLIVFGITVIHWFNPLALIAYVYMNQDMEMSCDEYVMKSYKEDIRKEYATSLLNLSVGRRSILGVPLAFGEGNVKGRIKNVTRYKKPLLSVAICTFVGCVVLGITLLTSPQSTTTLNKVVEEINNIDESRIESIVIRMSGEEQTFPAVYGNQIIEFLKTLKVENKEISKDRSETREKEISIIISYGMEYDINYALYITGEQIWLDNGVKPSYSYKIVNENEVEEFVKRLFGSIEESSPVTEDNELPTEEEPTSEVAMEEIEVIIPTIDLSMNLGADGAMLDYADGNIVIFHGYFGLFVYDLNIQKFVRAVDLEAIGCNYTQGDNYCEVSVSEDGTTVYLHPLSKRDMYVFDIPSGSLYKTAHNLDDITLFDGLVDNSDLAGSGNGFYSIQKVVFKTNDLTYYGYLYAGEEATIRDLAYVEDDMVFSLFESFDNESIVLEGVSMSVKKDSVTANGAVITLLNKADKDYQYGQQYFIQKYEDGRWYHVPYVIEDFGFEDIEYGLEKDSKSEFTIDWNWLYGSLEIGEYRIVKDIMDFRATGDYDVYTLTAEFTIE